MEDFEVGQIVWIKDDKLWGRITEVAIKTIAIKVQYTGVEYIVLKEQVISINDFKGGITIMNEEIRHITKADKNLTEIIRLIDKKFDELGFGYTEFVGVSGWAFECWGKDSIIFKVEFPIEGFKELYIEELKPWFKRELLNRMENGYAGSDVELNCLSEWYIVFEIDWIC